MPLFSHCEQGMMFPAVRWTRAVDPVSCTLVLNRGALLRPGTLNPTIASCSKKAGTFLLALVQ